MVLEPLHTIKRYLELRGEQWMDPEQVERLQRSRLERMIESALETPYYRKVLGSLGHDARKLAEEPETIPITEKDIVRRDTGRFLRKGTGPLRRMQTSGSSGNPLDVYLGKSEMRERSALGILIANDFKRSPLHMLAEISRTPFHTVPLLPAIGLFRKLSISVFDDEKKTFSTLCKKRPDILGWYPSTAWSLAKLNDAEDRPLRLKSVYSSGEVLSKEYRHAIEDSFSCPVFEQYASMEFATIAWECPEEHSLHVNSSQLLLEILDESGKAVDGGTGSIVISSLSNHAMPLLRYRIGDAGRWGKRCPCGRGTPVLDSIKGRTDDYIVLPSGKLRSCFAFNLLYYGTDIKGVWKYQIVQESEGLLVFRYVPEGKGMPEAGKQELLRRMDMACLGEDVSVEFEEVENLPRDRSGKLRKIISKVWERTKHIS